MFIYLSFHKRDHVSQEQLVLFFLTLNFGNVNAFTVIIKMGNKNIQGLPSVITKNWHSISCADDVFKSKLTSECVREQIINISNPKKIEELKHRMKETNPYICRVVFYSHISQANYYVYTDQTRNKPYVHNLEQWKIHKQNIVDAFITLSKRYGPTRVSQQMIGVDLSGQIKVWINPNPALSQPWHPCLSESQMIADILSVCRNIRQESTKNKNQEVKELEEINKTQLLNNNLTLKINYQVHRRQHTGEIKKQSTKIKQKTSKKFIPQAKKILFNNTGNLKISDSKTKCSENSKGKHQAAVYDSFTAFIPSISDSSFIQDSQSLQNRSRTASFGARSIKDQKKLNSTCNNLSLKMKNPLISGQRFSMRKNQKQNSLKEFQYSLQKIKKLQKETAKTLNQLKKTAELHREKKTLDDLQVKNYTISMNLVNKIDMKIKEQQKLSNKLGNVIYMPVRQERQSQLTYDELSNKTPRKKPKEHKQMTISQELFQFFDDEDKKEAPTPTKLRKRSVAFQQFRKQISELFD